LSLKPREITVQEAVEGERPTKKASIRKEGQAGDPRFLQIAQRCIDQRADLLGLSTATEAAKALGTGLAGLLAQAHASAAPASPMAEA
jgi:hypothetical protein